MVAGRYLSHLRAYCYLFCAFVGLLAIGDTRWHGREVTRLRRGEPQSAKLSSAQLRELRA